MIKYIGNSEDLEIIESPLEWQKRGLQETASGYGSKLTTSQKVKYNDRWYRIYCCIYGNSGSLYIISKGEKLYIR